MISFWRDITITALAWLTLSCGNEHVHHHAPNPSLVRQLKVADSLFEKSGTQAISYYRYLYEHLDELKQEDQTWVAMRLSECWHDQAHYDSAFNLLDKTLRAETIIQDSTSLLIVRLHKARLHQDLEQVDSAQVNFFKCKQIAEKLHSREFIFKAKFGLANSYSSQNQLGQSQQVYFQLIPEAIALKDSFNLANIYQNIAFNYQLKNKNKEAIRFYHLAKEYHITKPSSIAYAEILNNLGTCYSSYGNLDSALYNYIASEMIFRMKNNKTGILRTVFNQANIKQKQGKFKEAETAYLSILKDARASKIKIAEGYVLSELAMLRFRQGNYELAVQLIDSSFNFLIANNLVARCHEILNNREEILLKAIGGNKSHYWWKQQEAFRAKINNPIEDSLLVNSELNNVKLPPAKKQSAKNTPISNRNLVIMGITALALTSLLLFQRRRNKIKQLKFSESINQEQLEIQALEAKERITDLMEKQKIWKLTTLNAQALSEELGLTAPQLEFIIQHLFKQPTERFILKYRVDLACELLDDPASAWMNSEQIATSCGFDSVTSFYKGFVLITGMQPSDFQKRRLN